MRKAILLTSILLLFGCSGKPSEKDIQELVVTDLMSNGGRELFDVENFQKTNGYEKSDKVYIADVRYELVFKKSMREFVEHIRKEPTTNFFEKMGVGAGIIGLKMQYGNFKVGDKVAKEEKVTLVKTENGWRIE